MTISNQPQIDLWDGRVGEKWAAMQVSLDAMLANATVELVSRVGDVTGQRLLDIGCGNGETCVIWAQGAAEVTGVDVSSPMLAVAAKRVQEMGQKAKGQGHVELIKADASAWVSERAFDLAVSQFGVMFFSDPALAFKTIAANLRPGGRFVFTCWRHLDENQWVTLPMGTISDLLPVTSAPVPHAPGPFALADKERLKGLLERAGFSHIKMTPFDCPVCVATEGGVDVASRFVMQIGPTSVALAEADKPTKVIAQERLKTALLPYEKNGCVNLGGAIWVVESVRA